VSALFECFSVPRPPWFADVERGAKKVEAFEEKLQLPEEGEGDGEGEGEGEGGGGGGGHPLQQLLIR